MIINGPTVWFTIVKIDWPSVWWANKLVSQKKKNAWPANSRLDDQINHCISLMTDQLWSGWLPYKALHQLLDWSAHCWLTMWLWNSPEVPKLELRESRHWDRSGTMGHTKEKQCRFIYALHVSSTDERIILETLEQSLLSYNWKSRYM